MNRRNVRRLSLGCLTLAIASFAVSNIVNSPSQFELDYQAKANAAHRASEAALDATQARIGDRAWVMTKIHESEFAAEQAHTYDGLVSAEVNERISKGMPFFYAAIGLFLAFVGFAVLLYITKNG